MDELRVPADFLFGLLHDLEQGSGIGAAESATGEAQAGAHLVPGPLRGLGPELFETLAHALLEVFIGEVAPPVADQAPVAGQEPGDGQLEERWQHKAMGQISGGSVENEDRRVRE